MSKPKRITTRFAVGTFVIGTDYIDLQTDFNVNHPVSSIEISGYLSADVVNATPELETVLVSCNSIDNNPLLALNNAARNYCDPTVIVYDNPKSFDGEHTIEFIDEDGGRFDPGFVGIYGIKFVFKE